MATLASLRLHACTPPGAELEILTIQKYFGKQSNLSLLSGCSQLTPQRLSSDPSPTCLTPPCGKFMQQNAQTLALFSWYRSFMPIPLNVRNIAWINAMRDRSKGIRQPYRTAALGPRVAAISTALINVQREHASAAPSGVGSCICSKINRATSLCVDQLQRHHRGENLGLTGMAPSMGALLTVTRLISTRSTARKGGHIRINCASRAKRGMHAVRL
jgi:hypothetical protein